MKKHIMTDPFEPIPEADRKEWEKLVREGIALVKRRDHNIWKLILLAGRVESRYGEGRVKRYADEIGLSTRTMHEYRWLNRAGVDLAFIDKWKGLSYSMVREVLRHTGKVSNPTTEYFLQYAVDRRPTIRAMQAYMMETAAPDRMRERAAETIKMALQDKQENEGFSDYIKAKLEELAEEHPELEDAIMRAAIVDVEDFNALKIAAGLMSDDEEKMVGQAKYQTDKVRRYYTSIVGVKDELKRHLEYGHENADDLRHHLEKLRDAVNDILATEFKPLSLPPDSVEEIPAEIISA